MAKKIPFGMSSDSVGDEYEQAYQKILGASRVGGLNDHGTDLIVPGFGPVQVKATPRNMLAFLTKSIALGRGHFIALCVGEPGSREEVLESLRRFGAWIGREIPNREDLLKGTAKIRSWLI